MMENNSLSAEPNQPLDAALVPHSLVVKAGAGTGKSYLLTERYLYHVKSGLSPLEVVAITFTEKAAAELRSRIRYRIQEELPPDDDRLAELEFSPISTIHSLAARICREHWKVAGVSPDFRVIDELEGKILNSEWLNEAIDSLPIEIFTFVSYSVLKEIIKKLLDDPILGEKSLAHDPNEWRSLVEKSQGEAFLKLISSPLWRESVEIIRKYKGKLGDKLEDQRAAAVEAVSAIETGKLNVSELMKRLNMLNSVKLNVGSAKLWDGGGLSEVKEALKVIREDCVKKSLKEELISLQWQAVDDKLVDVIPRIRESFNHVRKYIEKAKSALNVLDFTDLEFYAIKALNDPQVKAYYAERWKAVLVDEFQDTNPVQSELLAKLTESDVCVTIVGDFQQSIYGFRRADIDVFKETADRITRNGGESRSLWITHRSHAALTDRMNTIFSEVIGADFQKLEASRTEAPHEEDFISAFSVCAEKGVLKAQKQLTEGRKIAEFIKSALEEKRLVYDKVRQVNRPVQPGDFAVLSRTWDPLDLYGEIIAHHDIPVVHAGGGNLLDTREAKDAWAMIRFLADQTDDVALITVLRSPFFGVSDKKLASLGEGRNSKNIWWNKISNDGELSDAAATLKELLRHRRLETPSRLLQIANRLTGYGAVIANLSNSERREADWRGFFELILDFEKTITDISVLVRKIKQLVKNEVKVPRPVLESRDAVALMTIHGAKGLEWPIVIIPDLSRENPNTPDSVYIDEKIGLGFQFPSEDGGTENPALYTVLKHRQTQREIEESKRLMYVALSRSRDEIALTTTSDSGGNLDLLMPGLSAAAVGFEPVWYNSEVDLLKPLMKNEAPQRLRDLQIEQVSLTFDDLTITDLHDYHLCPARFRFKFYEGHPGFEDEIVENERFIRLIHHALRTSDFDISNLVRIEPLLSSEKIKEAVDYAKAFLSSSVFSNLFETQNLTFGQPATYTYNGTFLRGVIDLSDSENIYVLENQESVPDDFHILKAWALSRASGKSNVYVLSLTNEEIINFNESHFLDFEQKLQPIFDALNKRDFTPNPSLYKCRLCQYKAICEAKTVEDKETL